MARVTKDCSGRTPSMLRGLRACILGFCVSAWVFDIPCHCAASRHFRYCCCCVTRTATRLWHSLDGRKNHDMMVMESWGDGVMG